MHEILIKNGEKEIAVFGGGCFWCTEAVFKLIKGVSAPILKMEPIIKENISGDKLLFYVNQ